jgi:regulator of nonsense transcripts 1
MDDEPAAQEEAVDGEGSGEAFPELPEYACAYCGNHDPSTVVKCISTGKWFCNGRVGAASMTCAVHHLVRGRHNQVRLHPESPLGDTVLECYATGNRNIFQLGFVPAKSDNVVVILSRDIAMGSSNSILEEMQWDAKEWLPLIKDHSFLPWLVRSPTAEEMETSPYAIRVPEMQKLEELWKDNPEATLDDLVKKEDGEEDISAVVPRYEDGYEYQNIFGPLVKLEADEDCRMAESRTQSGIRVRWEVGSEKRYVATFVFNTPGMDAKMNVGDELELVHPEESWTGVGVVLSFNDGECNLELQTSEGTGASAAAPSRAASGRPVKGRGGRGGTRGGSGGMAMKPPVAQADGYELHFIWRSTSYDRMQTRLKRFAIDDASVSGYLYHRLLGHDVEPQLLQVTIPKVMSVPGLPALNGSQAEAIRTVLVQPLSLIQGPPGTGKTVTSASLVYHLSRVKRSGQILVCAPSNVAVDQLTEKIHATGLRVVRLAAKSREKVDSPVSHLCLHNMVQSLASDCSYRSELRALQVKKDAAEDGRGLKGSEMKKYYALLRRTERELLKTADVICCTCVGSADPRLRTFTFKTVLIDEATQSTEPEALIPVIAGCEQLVLVGDHCQLGPVVMCKPAARAGLSQSLFERLVILGVHPIRLQVQYRMHPCLSVFPSNTFYEGTLQNGVTEEERAHDPGCVDFPWPQPATPMMFWVNSGTEEIASSGTSYLNRTEAMNVERVVTHYLKGGARPDQIGVITPYEGQRAFVTSYMARSGELPSAVYRDIEVASVDSFQGREKDYIILSCVRSNAQKTIGFLKDPRRLNVALTRAKYGVVILGNPKILSRHPLWNNLLVHYKEMVRSCESCALRRQLRVSFPSVLLPPLHAALTHALTPPLVHPPRARACVHSSSRCAGVPRRGTAHRAPPVHDALPSRAQVLQHAALPPRRRARRTRQCADTAAAAKRRGQRGGRRGGRRGRRRGQGAGRRRRGGGRFGRLRPARAGPDGTRSFRGGWLRGARRGGRHRRHRRQRRRPRCLHSEHSDDGDERGGNGVRGVRLRLHVCACAQPLCVFRLGYGRLRSGRCRRPERRFECDSAGQMDELGIPSGSALRRPSL